MLLVLKLVLVPALVVAVTLATRWWGPRVGGWLTGMPIVAGPALFFLALEQGDAFASEAARATLVALIGVAVLAITLVPALIPIFMKGRIKSEDESWLVRTMIAIFKPMLSWLMDRPTLVCWLFVCILGTGYLASTRLGREFMPDLDEGSFLEMPTTVPRVSRTRLPFAWLGKIAWPMPVMASG